MTYQNIEIKACPFCGRKDFLHIDRYQSNGEWWAYVECTECICSGPVGKQKRDAVLAWNERMVNMEDVRDERNISK